MNRILYTSGNGKFIEGSYQVEPCKSNEIFVKSVLTGICRSDIDMMIGEFGPLPISMSGHEGVGKVVSIGKNIVDVIPGDYVATRGEPAYADYYNVRQEEYVKIPSAEPKYIIEPVACGVNLIYQKFDEIVERQGLGKRLLILGSGFLAWVAYNTIKINNLNFAVDVVGNNNKELWAEILNSTYSGEYDVIIDLSSKTDVFDKVIYKENALIIIGSQKNVTTNFSNMLWKAVTLVFPSPRNPKFYECMKKSVEWIESKQLNVDNFWTKSYNRDTEWQEAFEDGINRPKNYSRGYIRWD